MKRLKKTVGLTLALIVLVSTAMVPNARSAASWRDEYTDILRDFAARDVQGRFLLYDIDGDGTPELIILSRSDFEVFVFTAGERGHMRLQVDSGAFAPFFASSDNGVFRAPSQSVPGIIFASYWSTAATYTRWVIDGDRLTPAISGGLTVSGDESEWRLGGAQSTQSEIEREFYSGEIIATHEITQGNAAAVVINWRSAARPTTPERVTAMPTQAAVLVNGERVAFQAYHIDGHNFFRVRDIAYTLSSTPARFNVTWDAVSSTVRITRGAVYTAIGGEMALAVSGPAAATPTQAPIQIGGSAVSLRAYHIDGSNYFVLRELGEHLGFGVDWDGDARAVLITTQ